MIAYLKGKLKYKNENHIVIDVRDVGYSVFVKTSILETAKENEELEFYIYHYIREDRSDFYGFKQVAELEFFEQLMSVTGIGPKSALAILSQSAMDDLKRGIIHGDSTVLTKVSGVGKKIAERIVLELKNKIDVSEKGNKDYLDVSGMKEEAEAIDGLVSLGYTLKEAREALKHVPPEAIALEDKVKAALKLLGKR